MSKQKGRVQSELTNSIVSKLLFVFCFFLKQKFLFSRKRFLSVSVETSSEKKDWAATSLKFFEPRAMVSILAQTLPEPVETTFESTFLPMSFQDIPLFRTSPTLRPSLSPTLSPSFKQLELQRTYQKLKW